MADEPCGSEEKSEFLPGYENVNEYTQQTLRAVLAATKCSNEMPAAGDDFDYYSSYPGFQDIMDVEGKRILHMIQNILKHQNVKVNLGSAGGSLDIEDKVDLLMDANDQILERVGNWLDEVSGFRKKESDLIVATAHPKQTTTASWNKKNSSSQGSSTPSYKLLSARSIQRPQLRFKDKVDNGSRPFYPIIKEKPNSLISLGESMKLSEEVSAESLENPDFRFPHPYKYEIDHLVFKPDQLSKAEPQMPPTLEETPVSTITTQAELIKLIETLKTQTEIAVDLEHHSYRTFQGITCLIQISTRGHDYLLDCLELRSDLHLLNEVFTHPGIVKVLHGADMDIDWLQRDLGVYVVNMFDTGQAARVMSHSRFSLAYLLQNYCNITADKQYQLADWRIRPLPEALVNYAREDTHYLLYIYDRIKNELIERGNEQKNLLMSVLNRSKDVCLRVYKRPIFKETDYLELYKKNKKVFNTQQMAALQNLFAWRDQLARSEDESLGYILPNHMLLQICSILPRESQGVLACCNPIPPLVRQFLSEIHSIILKAREVPLQKLTTEKEKKPSGLQHPKYDINSLLHCPHDLSHLDAVDASRTETLLDRLSERMDISEDISLLKREPVLTVFSVKKRVKTLSEAQKRAAEIQASFVSPFDQFLPSSDRQQGVTVKLCPPPPTAAQVSWKLLPNTLKRKEQPEEGTEEPVAKRSRTEAQFPVKQEKVEDAVPEKTEDNKKALPDDVILPLRFGLPARRKRDRKKNRNRDIDILTEVEKQETNLEKLQSLTVALGYRQAGSSSTGEGTNVKGGKMKQKRKDGGAGSEEEEEEKGGFTPYDYSQGNKLLEGKRGDAKGYYDPMSEMRDRKGPKTSRSRTKANKGKKSFTWKS